MEFTLDEAIQIGNEIGIDWDEVDQQEFLDGINVEMEHGSMFGQETNVTNDDPVLAGRIALAHLYEIPDYYTRLQAMESQAQKDWSSFDD